MTKKHRTHLPERFLLRTPEENLIAAIIKQAWCDAFMDVGNGYLGLHNEKEKITAKKMFETNDADEWRQSLHNLCDIISLDGNDFVRGYRWYKTSVINGTASIEPEKAFDVLLKALVKRKERK